MSILETLADRRCFIVAQLVPRADGKVDKIPFNPKANVRNKRISAHDPKHWMLPAEAAAWVKAARGNFGVGIVLTPDLKLACVDVDSAWDGTAWSPLARELYNIFAGCYFEVSQSGRGIHLIFSYTGDFPLHDCKNIPLHIELYHERRFIFLTGRDAHGNALQDCTAAAAATIARYFPPMMSSAIDDARWTDEPIWKVPGHLHDEPFISQFLASKSNSFKLFGKGYNASNEAVWTANAEELRRYFPPDSGGDYDASSVDESLAVRLMWWTGGNCERVLRLMQRSNLVRSKWEREDYLPRTVLKALKFVSQNPPTRQHEVPAPKMNVEMRT